MRCSKPLLAAALVLPLAFASLTSCSVVRGESSVSEYSNDAATTATIKAKLVQSDEVSATRVHVETKNGVVLLSGFVRTSHQKAAAGRIASSVKEVKQVRNQLVVG